MPITNGIHTVSPVLQHYPLCYKGYSLSYNIVDPVTKGLHLVSVLDLYLLSYSSVLRATILSTV